MIKNHAQALPFVNRLFELFDDPEVGWDAARAIGQAGTADKVLTKRNHAVIKVASLACVISKYTDFEYSGTSLPEVREQHPSNDRSGNKRLDWSVRIIEEVYSYGLPGIRAITPNYMSRRARSAHQGDPEGRLRA